MTLEFTSTNLTRTYLSLWWIGKFVGFTNLHSNLTTLSRRTKLLNLIVILWYSIYGCHFFHRWQNHYRAYQRQSTKHLRGKGQAPKHFEEKYTSPKVSLMPEELFFDLKALIMNFDKSANTKALRGFSSPKKTDKTKASCVAPVSYLQCSVANAGPILASAVWEYEILCYAIPLQ